MKNKMTFNFLSLGLCLFLFVGCGEKKVESDKEALVVITSPDNPPFEFKDTAKGGDKVIGFDMDVIQKLSEYLGRPIQIVEADFASLIPSLQSGRADMAISELAPTEERRKSVDFSNPYYSNTSALIVPQNSSITSENDLQGQKLGVQLGSTNEITGRKLAEKIPHITLLSLSKVGNLVQELKSGRIQAALVAGAVAKKVTKSTPGLKVVKINIPPEELVIVFPKGSPHVASINEALEKIKGDIKDIESRWITL
ncbi:MAG: hypothetical protein ACD_16C00209G0043 [uncultured bacterium]|nr:MAG: hypothetical protein ACD_16C00209G0043 [uncultured bacterium]OFW68467.1 MAG: hypothetical protein A2X70_07210 [Alphaproteobacteria bacterium GWC2_42_16]OFW73000.1 MAG: hypothetical protein A2Z80_02975 [Alphaproteobacteria bacterium GWA2_41_27]OFW81559.1 MAG: hypothetical protein A3E50_05335 [Alphaproteobacteria bacterium RIFCSPHIGHO2_12_FULL_42_100]OFW86811.1 MAG: hypothetical protein A2W06_06260 [Alphaproteobacteria bacterium RBG_16_42_14]OFW90486.1 MAG: hypothetical protein A3C41_061